MRFVHLSEQDTNQVLADSEVKATKVQQLGLLKFLKVWKNVEKRTTSLQMREITANWKIAGAHLGTKEKGTWKNPVFFSTNKHRVLYDL